MFTQDTYAALQLRRLVTGLSSRRPGLAPMSVHVVLVVDKGARRGLSLSSSVFPVSIVPSLFHMFYLFFLSHYMSRRRLGERKYSSYSFSTSGLDGGQWSASRPSRALALGERTPGNQCTGGWVVPRAGLDTEVRCSICAHVLYVGWTMDLLEAHFHRDIVSSHRNNNSLI
jgi:hypothetical protein